MSSVADLAAYLQTLVVKGCGDYSVYLGTRGLDCIRPHEQPMRLERPHAGDEIAHDGQRKAFLRAAEDYVL